MTHPVVPIQVNPTSVPSTPSWMGEVAAVAQVLTHVGLLKAIQDEGQFARARFGAYDTIDARGRAFRLCAQWRSDPSVLLCTSCALCRCLHGALWSPSPALSLRPFALSFLAALDQKTVEALRTQFLEDLLTRTSPFPTPGGLWDRCGQQDVVVDADGPRQAARQRALPQLPSLPAPHRRLDQVCAPGDTGRKRGEVVRTRTTLLQAHTHQFLGPFGGPGNGDYRGELKRVLQVLTRYTTAHTLLPSQIQGRVDGLYGDAAVLSDVLDADLGLIGRSRD